MKTEELITQLAADAAPVRPRSPAWRALPALAGGLAVSAGLFAAAYGARPDLAEALARPLVAAKTALPLALGVIGLGLAVRAARPGAGPSPLGRVVWLVPLTVLALFIGSFAATGAGERLAAFIGHSIHVCLPSIVLLSAPMTALLLLALKDGAPVRPGRCGALAGLAAAGFATALYSLFCTEDSPLFYAVWYSLGIAAATALAGWAGGRVLRW